MSILDDDLKSRSEDYRALAAAKLVKNKRVQIIEDEINDKYKDVIKYGGDREDWKDFVMEVQKAYRLCKPIIKNYSRMSTVDYSDLQIIDEHPEIPPYSEKNLSIYKHLWDKLIELLYDIGVTDISVNSIRNKNTLEIFNGTPFEPKRFDKNWAGWYYLLTNISSYRNMLRKDVDGMIVITGGNRVGKSTLALQLTDIVHPRKFNERNIVFDDEDFWDAADNLGQYGSFFIDELSHIFYSKDFNKSGQKDRKKLLKTYAKRNMLIFGCTLNFFNIDSEIRKEKITAVIHVPRRGRFEFYSRDKVNEFEKSDEGIGIKFPKPDFKGRFPKLEDDNKLWKIYKELEDDKVTRKDEDETSNEQRNIIKEVKEKLDRYTKEYGKRTIINRALLEADFDIGKTKANKIKAKLEADMDL